MSVSYHFEDHFDLFVMEMAQVHGWPPYWGPTPDCWMLRRCGIGCGWGMLGVAVTSSLYFEASNFTAAEAALDQGACQRA